MLTHTVPVHYVALHRSFVRKSITRLIKKCEGVPSERIARSEENLPVKKLLLWQQWRDLCVKVKEAIRLMLGERFEELNHDQVGSVDTAPSARNEVPNEVQPCRHQKVIDAFYLVTIEGCDPKGRIVSEFKIGCVLQHVASGK